MTHTSCDRSRREGGVALLVTALILILISGVGISAIDRASQEALGGGRSRATTRSLYAADAGIEIALSHLSDSPPLLDPLDLPVGVFTVQSRTRSESTPQQIEDGGFGPPPDGYEINVGSGYFNELYVLTVTAASPAGSSSEIEAKLAKLTSGGSH